MFGLGNFWFEKLEIALVLLGQFQNFLKCTWAVYPNRPCKHVIISTNSSWNNGKKSNLTDISFFNDRPLNMLDSYENRLGFSASFGVSAYECFAITFQSYGMVLGPETAGHVKRHVPSYLSSR